MNTNIKKIFRELALQGEGKAEACEERILGCRLSARSDKTRKHTFLTNDGARTLKEVFCIPKVLCAYIDDVINERDMTALQVLWLYRLVSEYHYPVYVTIDRYQELQSETVEAIK